MKKYHWVYILNCSNGAYYTGYTTDIGRRYQEHVTGTGKCKYTRSFKPVSIAQCWKVFGSKAKAMRVEQHIKKMRKDQKHYLILHPEQLAVYFRCEPVFL